MPKLGNTQKAILITKSDYWTTTIELRRVKKGGEEEFCLKKCPHKNEVCKGNCIELKEYLKSIRPKRNKKG